MARSPRSSEAFLRFQGLRGWRVPSLVCPPPDEGLYSIAWRLGAFVPQEITLFGVGASSLAAIALLVSGVHAAASPSKLRYLRNGALGVTVAALLPFVGAVLVLNHQLLSTVTRYGWDPSLLKPLIRHVVCCVVILVLGAFAAASPATAAALSAMRLHLAKEHQDLGQQQLRKWATFGGAPVGALLLLTTWVVASTNVGEAISSLWIRRSYAVSPFEILLAGLILLVLPTAALAAVAVPVRAANRSAHFRRAPAPWSTEPSRFTACPALPKQPNPPANLRT